MKKYFLIISAMIWYSINTIGQGVTLPPSGDNQKCSVTQHIGSIVNVTVRYSSPNVTGRMVRIEQGKFGALQ